MIGVPHEIFHWVGGGGTPVIRRWRDGYESPPVRSVLTVNLLLSKCLLQWILALHIGNSGGREDPSPPPPNLPMNPGDYLTSVCGVG